MELVAAGITKLRWIDRSSEAYNLPPSKDEGPTMKKPIAFLLLGLFLFQSHTFAYRYTRGYAKKSGAYVAPHYSTSPNSTKADNWSSQGNVNPFTGKRGYKDGY